MDLTAGKKPILTWRFCLGMVAVSVFTGLVGMFFTWVVELVQEVAFGPDSSEFAEEIARVPHLRIVVGMLVGSVLVAVGWYFLRRGRPKVPSPGQVAAGSDITMTHMLADTTLQVINVGFGASIGREAAPRQVGALAGSHLAKFFNLNSAQRALLVASGAGAGLGALYNVPWAGAVFAFEIMIGWRTAWQTFSKSRWHYQVLVAALAALGSSWLATIVARPIIPDRPTYDYAGSGISPALIILAFILGPLMGLGGHYFGSLMDYCKRWAPKGARILWQMPLVYLVLAALTLVTPFIMGNGHVMAERLFANSLPLTTVALLAVLKPAVTVLTGMSGATGGRLTPSFATGAALGLLIAAGLGTWFNVPALPLALVCASAFLSGNMYAPLVSTFLGIEFVGAPLEIWPLVAVGSLLAWVAVWMVDRRAKRQV